MNIFDIYKTYRAAYENPISTMWRVYRRKEFIPIIFKDHNTKIWAYQWVDGYANTINLFPEKDKQLRELFSSVHKSRDENDDFITFNYKNYQCKFYGAIKNGRTINGDIVGVFCREEYKFLNPENSTIIDIGTNIGDSAIYFSLNNAKRVIALEPYPFSHNYALKNININNLNDKIILLNAGYGKDSEVNIKSEESNGSSILKMANYGIKINIYSLKSLLSNYKLNDNNDLLLKMDCEGCEYNLLDEPVYVLRKFKRIEIEFHYGYKNLESKLKEAGFYVRHSKPIKLGGSDPSLRKMALLNKDLTRGMIYAERHTV